MAGFKSIKGNFHLSPVGQFKRLFFSTDEVIAAVSKGTRKALARAAGFIRQVARRSMRPAPYGTHAPPGHPPYTHQGNVRRFLYFGWLKESKTVVIGPVKLARSTDAPHTLEWSGETKVPRFWKSKRRVVKVEARPYMAPALQKSLPRIPEFWRKSVEGK